MNGRVYDYNLGRFMSVDPFIQSPTSTQSVNPYSYIMNNPLSGTDPTGYACTMAGQANGSCGSDIAGVDITTETEMTNGETKVKVKIEVVNGQKNSNKGSSSTKVEDEGKSDKKKSTNQSQLISIGNAFNEFIGLPPEAKAAANDTLENAADWLVIDDAKETISGIASGNGTAIATGVVGLACKPCKAADKLSDFAPDPVAKAISDALKPNNRGTLTIDGQDALATIRQQRGKTGTGTLDTSQSDREFYNNIKRTENELEQKTNRGTRYKWKNLVELVKEVVDWL